MVRVWTLTRISENEHDQANSHEYQQRDLDNDLATDTSGRQIIKRLKEDRHGEYFEKDNKGNPSAIMTILEGSRNHQFDELWLWDCDRLCRDVDMHGYIKFTLKRNGQKIVFLHSKGFWDEHVKIGISAYELRQRRKRVDKGMTIALEKGVVCQRPPYGYRISETKPKHLVIEQDEGLNVIDMYQRRNSMGVRKMAKHYGMPSSTIAFILKNEFYRTGEVKYKGKVITTVEPLLKGVHGI